MKPNLLDTVILSSMEHGISILMFINNYWLRIKMNSVLCLAKMAFLETQKKKKKLDVKMTL